MNIYTDEKGSTVLGSGFLYAIESKNFTISNTIDLSEMVEIGYIKDSAKFTRTHETKTITSANYGDITTLNGKYETTFDTNIISYNAENVARFLTGDKVVTGTPTTSDGVTTTTKTTYFVESSQSPEIALVFVGKDKNSGDELALAMPKCKWQGEYVLDFNNDNPIETNYSFKCFNTILSNGELGAGQLVETTKTAAT